jgi:hypothetical protein
MIIIMEEGRRRRGDDDLIMVSVCKEEMKRETEGGRGTV